MLADYDMPRLCFDVLLNKLDHTFPVRPVKFPDARAPVFVSWHKGRHRELRGCIGTFSPSPLHSLIPKYAIVSSMEDPRFPPISRDELPLLHCDVSVLTDFEQCSDPFDWIIGTHGIVSKFTDGEKEYEATYLPSVCKDQGWSQKECLLSLIRKAGYRSTANDDFIRRKLQVQRYRSSVVAMSYGEWKQIK